MTIIGFKQYSIHPYDLDAIRNRTSGYGAAAYVQISLERLKLNLIIVQKRTNLTHIISYIIVLPSNP